MRRKLNLTEQRWRLHKPFRIARETFTEIPVLHCQISEGRARGRSEAAGVDYRGESIDGLITQLEAVRRDVEGGVPRSELPGLLGPGGARNALDCALWDLEAKQTGRSIWQLLGLAPRPVTTVYTVGIDDPERMAQDAGRHRGYPTLKLKAGRGDVLEQVRAVRRAAPAAELVIDVNQGWSLEELQEYAPQLARLGVAMIEQPLPLDDDLALEDYRGPVPLCADESCQDRRDLPRLRGRYQLVNIKLDKTGGLSEALAVVEAARVQGLGLMVGNMLGSSLAMAPAFVIAQHCRYVDLDGPLLQESDHAHPLRFERGRVQVPDPRLWG